MENPKFSAQLDNLYNAFAVISNLLYASNKTMSIFCAAIDKSLKYYSSIGHNQARSIGRKIPVGGAGEKDAIHRVLRRFRKSPRHAEHPEPPPAAELSANAPRADISGTAVSCGKILKARH
jgi:hypothetical protein